jgi:ubiquitin-protein ligase E3 A
MNNTLLDHVDIQNDFMALCASLRPPLSGKREIYVVSLFPFAFPLALKAAIYQASVRMQMIEGQIRCMGLQAHVQLFEPGVGPEKPVTVLSVRRKSLLSDAIRIVGKMSMKDLRKPLRVKFSKELGIDGGGVSREFINQFFDKLFTTTDMFSEVERRKGVHQRKNGVLWFNPLSDEPLHSYRAVGRVLGLAMFNNCLCSIAFPHVLFRRLLGWPVSVDDMVGLILLSFHKLH